MNQNQIQMNDHNKSLLTEIIVDENDLSDSEKNFITDLYYNAKKHCKRENIYKTDLLFDSICIQNACYWFEETHPVAETLVASDRDPVARFAGPYGKVVVFDKMEVLDCLDHLFKLCETYGLPIDEN